MSFKMEKQKLKRAIARAIDSRILHSYNHQKREVMLRMDDDLFDSVIEALSEEI